MNEFTDSLLTLWFHDADNIRKAGGGDAEVRAMTRALIDMCKTDGIPYPRYIALFY